MLLVYENMMSVGTVASGEKCTLFVNHRLEDFR